MRQGAGDAFHELRPRLRLLMELYRTAATQEARDALFSLVEQVFLSTAWHVAADLVDNGWEPEQFVGPRLVRLDLDERAGETARGR